MLGDYDEYMPHTAIKGQVLANFVEEFTESITGEGKGIVDTMTVSASIIPTWEVYTNGTANGKGAGIGIVVITPEKLVMEKSLRSGFLASNDETEFEALLARKTMVNQLKGEVVEVYSNSWLVVGQVNREFEARDKHMRGYLIRVKQAQVHFKSFTLMQIPR